MRLEDNTLVLSERNLLSLLTKLYTNGSMCEIAGGEDCPMSVRAESDEQHYAEREYGPGPMHPVTERIIAAMRKALSSDSENCPLCQIETATPGTCDLPPKGWFCTLEKGHEGPCPTWPEHHRSLS